MEPDRTDERIADDEILYRRVLGKDIPVVEGERRLSSQAFTDRHKEPSVDRAKLRNYRPELTQLNPTCAVFSVTARQVREIELPLRTADGQEVMVRPFDVRPEPEHTNPSHAVIYAVLPEFKGRNGFDKLLKELRKIAVPVILPTEDA
jgi:hypothetical protein